MDSNFKLEGDSTLVAIDGANGGLKPGDYVVVNGSQDLQNIITGNNEAKVFTIQLAEDPGVYDYILEVSGEGPSGITSGSFSLHFTDQSSDTYGLSLWQHKKMTHTVAYNSESPDIVKIMWNE